MNRTFDVREKAPRHEVASVSTDIRVRVLNVSAAGCLIETRRPLEVGSVATLRINFAGGDFEDTVQIVRCHEITGAGTTFHLGATFLTTAAPSKRIWTWRSAWRSGAALPSGGKSPAPVASCAESAFPTV